MLASFCFCLFLVVGCAPQPETFANKFSGATMGTSYHITLVTDEALAGSDIAEVQKAIDERLAAVNQSMSTYIADSEINQLHSTALNEWHPISSELGRVLAISESVSKLSGGAFDITVRPLIDMWGFGPKPALDQVPPQAEIDTALANVGYQYLHLRQEPWQLLRDRDVDMDLSAVAKGYGVDVVTELLLAKGYANHMVEIGGELRLAGLSPRGEPWRIAVEKPQAGLMQSVYRAVSLTDTGMATSGDYRNYFEQDGVRYSHTIDPRSGQPIRHGLASVTVLHPSAAYADALATAFNVMGEEQALLLANSEGIAALFIIRDGDEFVEMASEAFQPYLEQRE
ncbi:FAD:protein FMN transferase [Pseudomaricurvus sp. HS19]|uniref:FAD:protein FMN transferase n=1 Tax=Pseudomaricurvus sp. HS19 TaxID=2692626 RepID=UPI00351A9CFE